MSTDQLYPLSSSYPSWELSSGFTSFHTNTPGHVTLASDDEDDDCISVSKGVSPCLHCSTEFSSLSNIAEEPIMRAGPASQSTQTQQDIMAVPAFSGYSPRHRCWLREVPEMAKDAMMIIVPTHLTSTNSPPLAKFPARDTQLRRTAAERATQGNGAVTPLLFLAQETDSDNTNDFRSIAKQPSLEVVSEIQGQGCVTCDEASVSVDEAPSPHSLSGSAATFVDHGAGGDNIVAVGEAGVNTEDRTSPELSMSLTVCGRSSLRAARLSTPSPRKVLRRKKENLFTLAPHYTTEYAIAVNEAAKYRWSLKEVLSARAEPDDDDEDDDDDLCSAGAGEE
jgi:hypothetical protein